MFRRNTDIQRHTSGFTTPQMNVDRLRLNGTPLSASLSALQASIPSSCDLQGMPLQIQQLLQAKVKFSMKIREREYEIQVEGSQEGNLMGLLQNEAPINRRCKEIEDSKAVVSPMKRQCQFEKKNSKKPRCGRKILSSTAKKVERHPKSAVLPTPASQSKEIKSLISPVKRQGSHVKKHTKKPRRPVQKFDGTSSSSDEDHASQSCITQQDSYIQTNTSNSMSLLQPMSQLTLNDISCGSSCSPVDDENSFIRPAEFEKLLEMKRRQHKQKKLLKLTIAESMLFESSKVNDSDCIIVSEGEAKVVEPVKKGSSDHVIKLPQKENDDKANDSSDSDGGDFSLLMDPKIKFEDTKAPLAKGLPVNIVKTSQGKSNKENIEKTMSSSSDDYFFKKPEKPKKKTLMTSKERSLSRQQRTFVGKGNKKT